MEKRVYKYGIEMEDEFTVHLPQGAEILSMQIQHGKPFIWALVDPNTRVEPRRFRLAGTGHPINNESVTFINTFQLDDGILVFHLFEIILDVSGTPDSTHHYE